MKNYKKSAPKGSPALFYGVAMAVLLADSAAAIVLDKNSDTTVLMATLLYLSTIALAAAWARIANRRDDRFGFMLMLMTVAAGPFGAGICFLAALVHERCAPSTLSPAEWIESLFEREPDRESDRLHERIAFGLDNFDAVTSVEPFADILANGAILQKQMAIAKIARYFRPAFAPLLLQAARDTNAAVRVQAATALAKIERDFMARYIKLENTLKDLPDRDPAKLKLAELYDEYAHAGLLDEGNRNELRLKAIGIYEACLAKRDNTEWRCKLARLYLRQNQPEKTCEWLEPVVKGKNPPRGAMLWYMEALFRLKKFSDLREISANYKPTGKKSGETTPAMIETAHLLNFWQAKETSEPQTRIASS